MSRPRLLDLFCGAGGAAMGYHRAGFDVVGVDIRPQPRYPFEFHQGDAMTWPLDGFDAIHASPPCQAYSVASNCRPGLRDEHPDLLAPTRARLEASGAWWVIENVPGAPMRTDYRLCGCMFGLRTAQRQLIRERWFETSWRGFDLRPACYHTAPAITISTKGQPNRSGSKAEAIETMGIDWMDGRERGLAIPPAYTEYIGQQLAQELSLLNGRLAICAIVQMALV